LEVRRAKAVVGLGLAGSLLAACSGGGSTIRGATATRDFLAAWRRSLLTSWSVDESVSRTTRNGRHLDFAVHRAQRPPDRVQIGLGSVSARVGGTDVACATGGDGRLECRSQGQAPPYGQAVDQELQTLSTYVTGAHPLYVVVERPPCFDLTLALSKYPVPPYGRRAEFCFDRASGAPSASLVVRDEGTDRIVVTSLHAPATAADLALPPGAPAVSG
jgi:hypothetical protein